MDILWLPSADDASRQPLRFGCSNLAGGPPNQAQDPFGAQPDPKTQNLASSAKVLHGFWNEKSKKKLQGENTSADCVLLPGSGEMHNCGPGAWFPEQPAVGRRGRMDSKASSSDDTSLGGPVKPLSRKF